MRADVLLTQEQLQKHIKESLPEGVEQEELERIEADMRAFMDNVRMLTILHTFFDVDLGRGRSWMRNYLMRFLKEDYKLASSVRPHLCM